MKRRTGCLIKRDCGYYVRMVIDGKVIVRALKNPDGTPSQTLVQAHRAQAIFAKVIGLENKNDLIEAVIRQITSVKTDIEETQSNRLTISGCWDSYLKSPDRLNSGEHTVREYKRYCRDFTDWMKAHYPRTLHVQDVTRAMATEFATFIGEGYSNVTFNKRTFFLKAMFRALLDSVDTPFSRIRPKPIDSVPHEALSPVQLKSLLAATTTTRELNSLILVGIYTGLRLGDSCLLRWSQLDLDASRLKVTPAKTAKRSHKQVVIPIHPDLKARLDALPHKSEYVLPYLAWRYTNDRNVITKRLHKAFMRAGIETKNAEGRTIFSFHSLRFSMGQALISAGFSLDTIAQVLGHSSQTMARHYSNLTDSVREKAILSLPSFTTDAEIPKLKN